MVHMVMRCYVCWHAAIIMTVFVCVQERMTLKHSSKGKWAKQQHTREHRDPAVSCAIPLTTWSHDIDHNCASKYKDIFRVFDVDVFFIVV